MPDSPLLDLQQKHSKDLHQMQRLMMLPHMQQAIQLLKMPILELAAMLNMQIEQNPLIDSLISDSDDERDEELCRLEEEREEEKELQELPVEQPLLFTEEDLTILQQLDDDFKELLTSDKINNNDRLSAEYRTYVEQSISIQPTLFEHLQKQAHETFESSTEVTIAETLIGYLNKEGYLKTPLAEIAQEISFPERQVTSVLQTIQTFEPYGVGATSLREALLIQLRCQGKQNSLATQIIEHHYEDLLHNRIKQIQKKLHCSLSEVVKAIDSDIVHLDLHPGTQYSSQVPHYIIPDIILKQEEDKLFIEVNEEFIPSIRINPYYLRMMQDATLAGETKQFIKKKLGEVKWLLQNVHQRNATLKKIAQALVQQQHQFFFHPDGELMPFSMRELADELGLHASTIARAVANKYIECPRGILSLRHFFSSASKKIDGTQISSNTVRETLSDIIRSEDRSHPLSDETLSNMLKARGILCARRTVAKYRQDLHLGNTYQRRRF